MTFNQMVGMYTRPGAVLKELLQDKANGANYKPGLRIILFTSIGVELVIFALAWLVFGLLSLVHIRLGLLLGAWLVLSPVAALVNFAKIFAVSAASCVASAWASDWIQENIFQKKGGQKIWLFNISAMIGLSYLPLLLIPVLGYLVCVVLVFWNLMRLYKNLYPSNNQSQAVVSILLSGVCSVASSLILGAVLGWVSSPVLSLDPFHGLQERMVAESLFASWGNKFGGDNPWLLQQQPAQTQPSQPSQTQSQPVAVTLTAPAATQAAALTSPAGAQAFSASAPAASAAAKPYQAKAAPKAHKAVLARRPQPTPAQAAPTPSQAASTENVNYTQVQPTPQPTNAAADALKKIGAAAAGEAAKGLWNTFVH